MRPNPFEGSTLPAGRGLGDLFPARRPMRAANARRATEAKSLADLAGCDPRTLEAIYTTGIPADPAVMGREVRGLLLAFGRPGLLTRALRAVARGAGRAILPWRGKAFYEPTNLGENVLAGGVRAFPFRWRFGFSRIDGRPSTLLRYQGAALRNPWPLRLLTDELRMVSPRFAIGPAWIPLRGRARVVLWWGLEWSA